MPLNRRIGVIGSAISVPAKLNGQSLEELLYEIVQSALADAHLTIDDIDGIVVAANDQFDGRAISVMAASGSVGGVDRDILSTPSASDHAFVMGVMRVASGQYRTQLIVSWSPTEAHSIPEAQRLAADPYFHRRLPLDDMASYSLQASALSGKVKDAEKIAADFNVSRGLVGSYQAKRSLIVDGMSSAPVTGAIAMIVADADFVAERKIAKVAWLKGMGWATETGFLGDRDLTRAPALEAARDHAYAEAGVTHPRDQFDAIEIADPTPYQSLIALEALGISKREDWAKDIAAGAFAPGGLLNFNPSGGARAANPVFCTGLRSIAEAANQVRGVTKAPANLALAHAASGFAMQYQGVFIFGAGN